MCESISSKLFPLRNLHAGLSDFTQARARARAHAKSCRPGKCARGNIPEASAVLSAIGRFASTRRGLERVSCLVRLGIVGRYLDRLATVGTLCVSALVFRTGQTHTGLVVHYTRGRRRAGPGAIKHSRVSRAWPCVCARASC